MFLPSKLKDNSSLVSLVGANLVPVFGVLFFDWNLANLVFLYWCESFVVAFWNVFRLWRLKGVRLGFFKIDVGPVWKKFRILPVLFFVCHYGLFTSGMGLAVWATFGRPVMSWLGLLIGLAGMFFSHGISYRDNYLGREEYKKASLGDIMFYPYRRLGVTQLTVLVGGFLIQGFGSPELAVIALALGKIWLDLHFHRKGHDFFMRMMEQAGLHTDAAVMDKEWQAPADFQTAFRECRPGATYTSPQIFGTVASYEIVGPKDGRCEMKLTYVRCYNPLWRGKSLACLYDNSLPFENAVTGLSQAFRDNSRMQCRGELFEVM